MDMPILMFSLVVGIWGTSGLAVIAGFLGDVMDTVTYREPRERGTAQASAVFIASTGVALVFLVLGVV